MPGSVATRSSSATGSSMVAAGRMARPSRRSGSVGRVLLRQPVVVAAGEATYASARDGGGVERALARHGREEELGVDAVLVHLGQPLLGVTGADQALVVGDARGLQVLQAPTGGEVEAERDGLALARHQPGVAAVGQLHHLGHELLELLVDVGAPQVGRHLEVRVGRDDLVVAHRVPLVSGVLHHAELVQAGAGGCVVPQLFQNLVGVLAEGKGGPHGELLAGDEEWDCRGVRTSPKMGCCSTTP